MKRAKKRGGSKWMARQTGLPTIFFPLPWFYCLGRFAI
ncbi:hypothetical protein, unlikely [Trypanosoma brucei brucei TREU927]|uniref:Uncharacterized protein n=1 Tax=Trypanosoma brucei brucei (strain 927/4 GUTat10.1) TaxID=185431 RepID=Q38F73_TRYB2|nr:hypothetical protein, unlikely [Trypanosoma brucei brucei TREU927]EAN76547.1 hypothetical protein, unlikely [Trypanosoma brucei brucei TREU927]